MKLSELNKEDIIIIPEFYEPDTFATIKQAVDSQEFSWFYNAQTSTTNSKRPEDQNEIKNWFVDEKTEDSQQYIHGVCFEGKVFSKLYHVLAPALEKLRLHHSADFEKICRIKLNSIPRDRGYPEGCYNVPHLDSVVSDIDHWSLLVYINDSDGDTLFFNELLVDKNGAPPDKLTIRERLSPKANMAAFFYSGRWHASSTPKETNRRVVVNHVLM